MVELFKSEKYNQFLDDVEKYVVTKKMRSYESALSITPYENGIQVLVKGEDEIVNNPRLRTMFDDNPEPLKLTRYPVRTIHLWWGELKRNNIV